MAEAIARSDLRTKLQNWIPKLVLSPSLAATLVFVYGFILFTLYLSFTDSRILPSFGWVGLENYAKLWRLSHWTTSITNLGIFASLYIVICCAIGLLLAIALDQKIRGEGVLRPIYLYPMALSFIVTGTVRKRFLDAGTGIENTIHHPGTIAVPTRPCGHESLPGSDAHKLHLNMDKAAVINSANGHRIASPAGVQAIGQLGSTIPDKHNCSSCLV